jgi:hypothetical protein
MASSTSRTLSIIASYDSFIKVSLSIARHFESQGWRVDFFICQQFPEKVATRHLQELGMREPWRVCSLDEALADPRLHSSDAILLSLIGSEIAHSINALHDRFQALPSGLKRRPVVAVGYCGIVYKRHFSGMLDRQGADVCFVNSPHDLARFRELAAKVEMPDGPLVLGGLPFLDSLRPQAPLSPASERDAIVFAGQPTVPHLRSHRMYVVERLMDLALRFPDRRVILKPRIRPDQKTVHEVRYYYQDCLERVLRRRKAPANFSLDYTSLSALFPKTSLLLTISSTAALEALALDIPVGIITDFGISEGEGAHFFAGSGLLTTFDRLLVSPPSGCDPAWRQANFLADGGSTRRIYGEITRLLELQALSGAMLPLPRVLDLGNRRRVDRYDALIREENSGGILARWLRSLRRPR